MPTTPPNPILTSTPRLHISLFNPKDPQHSTFLHKLATTTPGFEDYVGHSPRIRTPTDATTYLTTQLQPRYAASGHRYGDFLVSRRPHPTATLAESVPIGAVYLDDEVKGHAVASIGYCVLPGEAGRGYASEVGRALVRYARAEMGLRGVCGICAVGDARSRRVLVKIGFVERGVWDFSTLGGGGKRFFLDGWARSRMA
ncbi:GNAT family N-acetyltransferase [Aspergillus homomorphus CBS 101889]|uniref:Acyl-CoA N-acyltransferase n=1 Tax=Aspergillus homomorphus (strain CBS 101889) TaxID=1450537 RepID=A0A395HU88_ASPHC|nr:acyl-CoA N-acyltransferase [Aspergillus homomorphus CBS 101889]RAL11491.1 acyl-CoA N-acyltransferase [Aspergillus homomorphus CBS 101889]